MHRGLLSLALASLLMASTAQAGRWDAQVGGVADRIAQGYVHADKAAEIAKALRLEAARGDFDAASSPAELAVRLTDRLKPYDLHFNVAWSTPEAGAPRTPAPGPRRGPPAGAERRANYGFQTVAVLPGNIGYLDLRQFSDFDRPDGEARRAADAAMAVLANTDAVIIDLRQNAGGSPRMVGYLASWFVQPGSKIYNTFHSRQDGDASEAPTVALPGAPRLEVPLYILTSGRTASAGEALPYTLQAAKRAIVVGERTAGAANPGAILPTPDGFTVFVPNAEPINPITHANWEGSGVKPDIEAPSDQALARAQALALETLLAKGPPSPVAQDLRWALESLRRPASIQAQAELANYQGVYGSRSVALESGRLVLHRERWPGSILLPLGGDLFAVEGDPARRVRFDRDGSGRITGLVQMVSDGTEIRHLRSAT